MAAALKVALIANDGHPIPDWLAVQLRDEGAEFRVAECHTRKDLIQHAADAEVLVIFSGRQLLNATNLEALPACKAIVRTGSGYDNIDVEAATHRGIVVANTPDVATEPTADHAVSLLFSAARQIPLQDRQVRSGLWASKPPRPTRGFQDAVLGLVGFGRIARAVVRKVSGFHMTILAYDPFVGPQTMADCQVQGVGLDELLTRADFVSLHCALNQDTYHLIGERELRLMRKDAILVNVSRGALVDERALYRALREGWIARAALDVTEEEPIAPDNPLLTLDNIVITPHSAAYSNLHPDAFWEATAKAIIALAHGRWPESAVNRKAVVPAWPLS